MRECEGKRIVDNPLFAFFDRLAMDGESLETVKENSEGIRAF